MDNASHLQNSSRPRSITKIREFVAVDWLAIFAGSLMGGVWWNLHKMYFVSLWWEKVQFHQSDGFAVMNLKFAALQGASVGFLTALLARKRPYISSLAALVLIFLAKGYILLLLFFPTLIAESVFFHSNSYFHASIEGSSNWRPPNPYWWKLFYIAYAGSLFCGAFVGQLLRRLCQPVTRGLKLLWR